MKSDRKIVALALKNKFTAIRFLSKALKDSETFIAKTARINKDALYYAS